MNALSPSAQTILEDLSLDSLVSAIHDWWAGPGPDFAAFERKVRELSGEVPFTLVRRSTNPFRPPGLSHALQASPQGRGDLGPKRAIIVVSSCEERT